MKNPKQFKNIISKHKNSFTLIELSIVLMILAMLIAGTMGGMRLVKSARMTKLISETTDYMQDYYTFYSRYEAVPGDFEDATTFFGTSDINGETIHSGDGDDLINGTDFSTTGNTETESAGFFHHLYISGIRRDKIMTGNDVLNVGNSGVDGIVSDVDEVSIDANFPGTIFGNKTFFYATSSAVDGRYRPSNRIVIATKDSNSINTFTPDEAETLDIKTDDGNPFKGELVGYNAGLSNGLAADDEGCTTLYGYDTSSTEIGCISERSLTGNDVSLTDDFIAQNGEDAGSGDEESGATCTIPSASLYTGLGSWQTVTEGGTVDAGTLISETCSETGYSGTFEIYCGSEGSLVSESNNCGLQCTAPAEDTTYDGTGYDYIASWEDTSDSSSVDFGETIDSGTTLEGTCATGYIGDEYDNETKPQVTCDGSTGTLDTSALTSCVPNIPTTNLNKWWDAEDMDGDGDHTDNPSGGTSVTTWNDANGYQLSQGNVSYKPIMSSMGGVPGVAFASDYLATNQNNYSMGMINSDYEIFITFKLQSDATRCLLGSENYSENHEIFFNGASGARFIPASGKYVDQGSDQAYYDGNVHLVNVRVESGATGYISIDGTQSADTEASCFSSSYSVLYIGAQTGPANFFVGIIGDVLIYSHSLTSQERSDVEEYLGQKYGKSW